MPKALPGFSGGKLPGRSKAESGKDGNDEEDGVRWVEKEVTNAVLTTKSSRLHNKRRFGWRCRGDG